MARPQYSAPVVICLCALCFIIGRFVQELPGLPQPTSKMKVTRVDRSGRGASLRRNIIETGAALERPVPDQLQPAQQSPGASGSGPHEAAPALPRYATFDAAVAASGLLDKHQPLPPGESGNDFYTTQPFQMLSWYPRIMLFPGFLDAERCQALVARARARLAPSSLALRKGDTADGTRDVRTSQGTFMARSDDPDGVLAWIEDKVAQLTGVPVNHGEPFNVLRYQQDQHYDSHYDVFDPESYGPQPSQRLATLLFYLTDVEEGGETVFPLEGAAGLARLGNIDYRRCDQGLKVTPRQGDAILFWSLHPNGTFDKHALHGGCPVRRGEKWVATKWIRDKCFAPC